jgi:hypothetical protein
MPSTVDPPDRKAIERIVNCAVDKLTEHDSQLLRLDVNERAISHRLACYLQDLLPDWHVDCEYNRERDLAKRLNLPVENVPTDSLEARTVYPDIIVHKRGSSENLLVIEMKKAGNAQHENHDRRKLTAFKDQLGYHYTLFLKLFLDPTPHVVQEWLSDA